MAYTSANTNMTASTGLTPGMQTYYNRCLLYTSTSPRERQKYRMPSSA